MSSHFILCGRRLVRTSLPSPPPAARRVFASRSPRDPSILPGPRWVLGQPPEPPAPAQGSVCAFPALLSSRTAVIGTCRGN